jgi:hypothetical protein
VILGAALLVLVALALFISGVVTGVTTLYWACVAVSAVAAVLLVVARRTLGRPAAAAPERAGQGALRERPERAERRDPEERREPEERPQPVVAVTDDDPVASGEPLPPREDAGPVLAEQPERYDALPRHDERPSVAEPFEPAARDEYSPPDTYAEPAWPPADGGIPTARHASRNDEQPPAAGAGPLADPPAEEVEVTDLLLVVDLTDEVLVIDEHPRYHLAGCPHLAGQEPIPLPMDEARTDGFTPCAVCAPDRHLAERERGRRTERRGY